MRLKGKLFIFMVVLFVFFSFSVWTYSELLLTKVNEKWAERFIKKQILFDKNRTLLPLQHELEIINEMIKEPALIEMALDDTNENHRRKGLAVLEMYRQKFHSKSYFAAFVKSENYYFNDLRNSYAGKELQYKLSKDSPNDAWFYYVINDMKAYQINVDTDEVSGNTMIWLNVDLRINDKVVGIVGTGFNFTSFLRESVGVEQEGIHNFFINRHLDVQLERDTKLIDYANLIAKNGAHKKISGYFLRNVDMAAIQENISYLSAHPEAIRTFWVEYDGNKKLLGMAYLKEVDWFSLTLIDAKELEIVKDFSIVPMLSIIFLVALLVVGLGLHAFILRPIESLKTSMQKVEQGNYALELKPIGSGEIEELSKQFMAMIEYVRENNSALEKRIEERTQRLAQSESKLNLILESVDAFIFIKNDKHEYLYVNKKACEYMNMELKEILGKSDKDFFDEKTVQMIQKADKEVLQYGRKITTEDTYGFQHGTATITCISTRMPLIDEEGKVYGLCGISTDITERKKTEELIRELAFQDSLTGLPNRRMFHEKFATLLAYAKRHQTYGALIVVDLDNFKPLNDTYGHSAGDLLLIEVAKRLQSCVRKVDVVARFGGDEFLVALGELGTNAHNAKEEALKIADKIRIHLQAPYVLVLDKEDHSEVITHECSASLGVSLFDSNKQEEERLFSEADQAMYLAKQKGRNRVEIHED